MCDPAEWDLISVIGKGGSSTVYKAKIRSSQDLVAIKQIEIDCLTKDQVGAIRAEIETMKSLSHPNIVSYVGALQKQNKIFILLEFSDRGSIRQLYQNLGNLPKNFISYCSKQMLLGLMYLHSNGIAHRDIKCANSLLSSNGAVKLADFGASKKFESDSVVSGLKGTPHWMAPEVIKGIQMTTGWIKADVWSLGCTIVEMYTGKVPYAEYENPMTAMYKIASGELPSMNKFNIKMNLTTPSEIEEFVKICCDIEPTHRPSVEQLLTHTLVTTNVEFSEVMSFFESNKEEDKPVNSNNSNNHNKTINELEILFKPIEAIKSSSDIANNGSRPMLRSIDTSLATLETGSKDNTQLPTPLTANNNNVNNSRNVAMTPNTTDMREMLTPALHAHRKVYYDVNMATTPNNHNNNNTNLNASYSEVSVSQTFSNQRFAKNGQMLHRFYNSSDGLPTNVSSSQYDGSDSTNKPNSNSDNNINNNNDKVVFDCNQFLQSNENIADLHKIGSSHDFKRVDITSAGSVASVNNSGGSNHNLHGNNNRASNAMSYEQASGMYNEMIAKYNNNTSGNATNALYNSIDSLDLNKSNIDDGNNNNNNGNNDEYVDIIDDDDNDNFVNNDNDNEHEEIVDDTEPKHENVNNNNEQHYDDDFEHDNSHNDGSNTHTHDSNSSSSNNIKILAYSRNGEIKEQEVSDNSNNLNTNFSSLVVNKEVVRVSNRKDIIDVMKSPRTNNIKDIVISNEEEARPLAPLSGDKLRLHQPVDHSISNNGHGHNKRPRNPIPMSIEKSSDILSSINDKNSSENSHNHNAINTSNFSGEDEAEYHNRKKKPNHEINNDNINNNNNSSSIINSNTSASKNYVLNSVRKQHKIKKKYVNNLLNNNTLTSIQTKLQPLNNNSNTSSDNNNNNNINNNKKEMLQQTLRSRSAGITYESGYYHYHSSHQHHHSGNSNNNGDIDNQGQSVIGNNHLSNKNEVKNLPPILMKIQQSASKPSLPSYHASIDASTTTNGNKSQHNNSHYNKHQQGNKLHANLSKIHQIESPSRIIQSAPTANISKSLNLPPIVSTLQQQQQQSIVKNNSSNYKGNSDKGTNNKSNQNGRDNNRIEYKHLSKISESEHESASNIVKHNSNSSNGDVILTSQTPDQTKTKPPKNIRKLHSKLANVHNSNSNHINNSNKVALDNSTNV